MSHWLPPLFHGLLETISCKNSYFHDMEVSCYHAGCPLACARRRGLCSNYLAGLQPSVHLHQSATLKVLSHTPAQGRGMQEAAPSPSHINTQGNGIHETAVSPSHPEAQGNGIHALSTSLTSAQGNGIHEAAPRSSTVLHEAHGPQDPHGVVACWVEQGSFRLPISPATPLILIGPGTGRLLRFAQEAHTLPMLLILCKSLAPGQVGFCALHRGLIYFLCCSFCANPLSS